MIVCKGCGAEKAQGQWWGLNKYFGFSGRFCADCYDKISHDSYGRPNHPNDHLLMLLKLTGVKSQ